MWAKKRKGRREKSSWIKASERMELKEEKAKKEKGTEE